MDDIILIIPDDELSTLPFDQRQFVLTQGVRITPPTLSSEGVFSNRDNITANNLLLPETDRRLGLLDSIRWNDPITDNGLILPSSYARAGTLDNLIGSDTITNNRFNLFEDYSLPNFENNLFSPDLGFDLSNGNQLSPLSGLDIGSEQSTPSFFASPEDALALLSDEFDPESLDPALLNFLQTQFANTDIESIDLLIPINIPEVADGLRIVSNIQNQANTIPEGVEGISFRGIKNAALLFASQYEAQLLQVQSLGGPPLDDREEEREFVEPYASVLGAIPPEVWMQIIVSELLPPVDVYLSYLDYRNNPNLLNAVFLGLAAIPILGAIGGLARAARRVGPAMDAFMLASKIDYDTALINNMADLLRRDEVLILFDDKGQGAIQEVVRRLRYYGTTTQIGGYYDYLSQAQRNIGSFLRLRNRLANRYLSSTGYELLYRGVPDEYSSFDRENPFRSVNVRGGGNSEAWLDGLREFGLTDEEIAALSTYATDEPIDFSDLIQILGLEPADRALRLYAARGNEFLGAGGIPFSRSQAIAAGVGGGDVTVVRVPKKMVTDPGNLAYNLLDREVIIFGQVDYDYYVRTIERKDIPWFESFTGQSIGFSSDPNDPNIAELYRELITRRGR